MFVVRQPDDTMAQLPAWMCSPEAAQIVVTDRPCIALKALRDLRQALDAVLARLRQLDA